MFAWLAALVFAIQLIFRPHWNNNLVVLGLLFVALHLATEASFDKVMRRWPRH